MNKTPRNDPPSEASRLRELAAAVHNSYGRTQAYT
jgi:hypothetical protein